MKVENYHDTKLKRLFINDYDESLPDSFEYDVMNKIRQHKAVVPEELNTRFKKRAVIFFSILLIIDIAIIAYLVIPFLPAILSGFQSLSIQEIVHEVVKFASKTEAKIISIANLIIFALILSLNFVKTKTKKYANQ